jgi:hypothetical protein
MPSTVPGVIAAWMPTEGIGVMLRVSSHGADRGHRFSGHLYQYRSLAAQSYVILLGDRGDQDCGGGGIHRVAALLQHAVSGFDFHVVARADHLMHAADGGEHRSILRHGRMLGKSGKSQQ